MPNVMDAMSGGVDTFPSAVTEMTGGLLIGPFTSMLFPTIKKHPPMMTAVMSAHTGGRIVMTGFVSVIEEEGKEEGRRVSLTTTDDAPKRYIFGSLERYFFRNAVFGVPLLFESVSQFWAAAFD